MKFKAFLFILSTSFILIACSDSNTSTTTTTTSTTSIKEISGQQTQNPSTQNKTEQPKSDTELALEGASIALDAISDLAERQKAKDSIRQANKDKMFAFQIGIKMNNEEDAFDVYTKLQNAGIPSVYVFKPGRKEYYVVQFEAKGEEELSLIKGNFKAQLGDLGNSGLKIINLNENFCAKRKSVALKTDESDGDVIKCLVCD